MRKKYDAPDKQLLAAAGIKHGDTLYIGNKDVVMNSVLESEAAEKKKADALARMEELKNALPKD